MSYPIGLKIFFKGGKWRMLSKEDVLKIAAL